MTFDLDSNFNDSENTNFYVKTKSPAVLSKAQFGPFWAIYWSFAGSYARNFFMIISHYRTNSQFSFITKILAPITIIIITSRLRVRLPTFGFQKQLLPRVECSTFAHELLKAFHGRFFLKIAIVFFNSCF